MLTKFQKKNYETTIPQDIRNLLKIKEGDLPDMSIKGEKIALNRAEAEWQTISLGKKLSIEEIEESIERGRKTESSSGC
jgi:bifunctional DNA-binding transcriptional regulator/antitoxin component of YhaV-PrlF toxin-antitoxin module